MTAPTPPPLADPRWTPCPSCGRRPSERTRIVWEQPHAMGWPASAQAVTCEDAVHDTADASPALYSALEALLDATTTRDSERSTTNERFWAADAIYVDACRSARAALQLAQPAGRKP